MTTYRTIDSCRSCGNYDLTPVLSLGEIYVIGFGEKESVLAPLDLVICDNCKLLQLKHTLNQEFLFRHYYYKSGINQSMKDSLADIVNSAKEYVHLKDRDVVLDIGSNDGTLLDVYDTNIRKIGFEPAENLIPYSKGSGKTIINEFFDAKLFLKNSNNVKAKVITAIAMFYDLDDPNKFVADVKRCLDSDGVFIIQQNYLRRMLDNMCLDNIVHEHLEYYSLTTLKPLLDRHGLTITDVDFNDVNGGSFRVYVRHAERNSMVDGKVRFVLDTEAKYSSLEVYKEFERKSLNLKKALYDYIYNIVTKGGKVFAYGASTRGNTLLQFCGLDGSLIPYASERNPAKFGKNMMGTGIKIISENDARKKKPTHMLVLPWQFLGEFVIRERDYLLNGGKFIVPLPQPYVLGMEKIE